MVQSFNTVLGVDLGDEQSSLLRHNNMHFPVVPPFLAKLSTVEKAMMHRSRRRRAGVAHGLAGVGPRRVGEPRVCWSATCSMELR